MGLHLSDDCRLSVSSTCIVVLGSVFKNDARNEAAKLLISAETSKNYSLKCAKNRKILLIYIYFTYLCSVLL